MVQKEVADRLTAEVGSKNYGRISVLSHVYSKTTKILDVGPENFYPKPRVNSSILTIEPKNFSRIKFDSFKNFLRKSFLYRRKMIKNNLSQFYNHFDLKLQNSSLDITKRPQDFSPNEFIKMYKYLFF